MTTITLDDTLVYEQRDGERIVHRCATRRVAQVLAATLDLQACGWHVTPLGSNDKPRLPLLLPGESMGLPLDGARSARSDDRAQGFAAELDGALLVVDACAGLQPLVLAERGNAHQARSIVEWYIGALA